MLNFIVTIEGCGKSNSEKKCTEMKTKFVYYFQIYT